MTDNIRNDFTSKHLTPNDFKAAGWVTEPSDSAGILGPAISYLSNGVQGHTFVSRQITMLNELATAALESGDERKIRFAVANLETHQRIADAFDSALYLSVGTHVPTISQLKARTTDPAHLATHRLVDALEEREGELATTKGIFRITGSVVQMDGIQKRVMADPEVDLSSANIHDLAGVLKRCLGETHLLDTHKSDLKTLVGNMATADRILLKRLLSLLQVVSTGSDKTLMDNHNLATVFSPRLQLTIEQTETLLTSGLSLFPLPPTPPRT